jgi:hypothetical protein
VKGSTANQTSTIILIMVNEDVFRKVKARVGKRAKSAPNETDVSFRKAGLHVAAQSRVSTASIGGLPSGATTTTTTTDRGLTVSQLAQQLKHPASAMRVSALKGFQNLLLDQKAWFSDQGEDTVRSYIGPASLVDISATVREEAFSLLQKLSVRSISMALVLSGLNSLDPRQAIHAASVLDWLLQRDEAISTDGAIAASLVPSLTRLLSPSTASIKGSNKLGGVLASSKTDDSNDYGTTKPKKRKRVRTTENAPNTNRLTVLMAIRSVLMHFPGIGSKADARSDGLKVLRELSDIPWHEFNSANASAIQVKSLDDGSNDLVSLMAKLRDVLLEENQTDFATAADCFRHAIHLLPARTEPTDKICEQVAKVGYSNGSTLLLLALAQTSEIKERTRFMKLVLREAALPTADNETFLTVARAVLESRDLEMTKKFWNAMKERFVAAPSTLEDMRSTENRLAVQLFSNHPQQSLMEEDALTRFPDFLVAWRGDFPANSICCLDRMKAEAQKLDAAAPIEQWRTGLEPLFEENLFVKLDETVQHRLICLVTTLGSPTPTMVRHWSNWIASECAAAETAHDYTSLMIQCMHGMRQQISVRLYLGFLIDATGVLQEDLLLATNWARVETRIEEVCWALRQIGPTKVLPKLIGILTTMIEQGKLQLVAKVLSQFASDLGEGESMFAFLPDPFSKRFVEECCRMLVKQHHDTAPCLLDLLRDDSLAMQLVLIEMASRREADPATGDLDRLLDFLLDEVILLKQKGVPVELLLTCQSLTKPSSALHAKIEGLKRIRGHTTG